MAHSPRTLPPGSAIPDDISKQIIEQLQEDGRRSYAAIGKAVGLSEAAVRQPDTTMFRTWEVAGSSHVDEHLRKSREPLELRDFSTSTVASSSEAILAPQCQVPTIGTRVPTGYVVGSAFDLLVRWVKHRTQPPSAPRIAVSSVGPPAVIERDSNGLALGGIRLSQLAVPTAVNVGVNSGPGACQRWGYYIPFPISQLDSLYPTHDSYVAQVVKVTLDNLQNQYIEAPDAQQTVMPLLLAASSASLTSFTPDAVHALFGSSSGLP